MNFKKDYTGYASLIAILVIVFLAAASRIPGTKIGEIKLKKINILSDLIEDDAPSDLGGDLYFDTTFLAEADAIEANMPSLEPVQSREQGAVVVETERDFQEAQTAVPTSPRPLPDSSGSVVMKRPTVEIPYLEDFGGSCSALLPFYEAMLDSTDHNRVRMAVLGDSFIEGDIVTADLREQLQEAYGGSGVGFVPFSSPIAQFRGTVRHVFQGWKTLDVKNARDVAEDLKDKFFVSGYLCIPEEGASVRLEGVGFRKHLWSVPECRLIFINRGQTCIQVTINDTIHQEYRPEPSEEVQQIRIKQRSIHSIECRFTGTEGFIGYGIVLGGTGGAGLDNYSIRGNSGLALFATNGKINRAIGAMFDYDLIILEYGLNVLTADVLHYDSYRKAFVRVINYMKRCFPDAAVLVMGICDRSMQNNGVFETMPSVEGMIEAQRAAAEETGVAFWNTFEAMGGHNSMAEFVAKNWAAKDYTHISYAGGKFVARKLLESLMQGVEAEKRFREEEAERLEQQKMESYNPVFDSVLMAE
ncbi:MAG TPA: hypothetical protein IAA13_06615 [Candidatus Alistipes merdigallinarum]|nr:hypothetical protein [Candidatus Alistipes merdigallinarum]